MLHATELHPQPRHFFFFFFTIIHFPSSSPSHFLTKKKKIHLWFPLSLNSRLLPGSQSFLPYLLLPPRLHSLVCRAVQPHLPCTLGMSFLVISSDFPALLIKTQHCSTATLYSHISCCLYIINLEGSGDGACTGLEQGLEHLRIPSGWKLLKHWQLDEAAFRKRLEALKEMSPIP